MKAILLGTGSPVPLINRAGTSFLVSTGEERVLIDCGPGTVTRLLEYGIHPGSIDRLFFTHHHVDHNADFYHFLVTCITRGGTISGIYGPEGTESLLESMYEIYEEDLRYREQITGLAENAWDISTHSISDESVVMTDRFRIEACAVEHSIETYAYRIEDLESGNDVVFSGDTRKFDHLAAFASGTDVLIQDSCIGPAADSPPDDNQGLIWESYTEDLPAEKRRRLNEWHCNPTEAGEIAADAEADVLVLTHLLPYRDFQAMQEAASAVFDGTILVAQDGLQIDVGTQRATETSNL